MSGIDDTYNGSILGDVLTFNPDAIPEPDTLLIRMTRGERRIADELHKAFGGFKRVVINVDGDKYEFSADSFIWLLEDYEDAQDMSNYMRLFGTPERAARTLAGKCRDCYDCVLFDAVGRSCVEQCITADYDALLEWLKQEVGA